MNPFGVSETKSQALTEQMARLEIREQDLEERFVRAGGPGGQNVNKVSTCVWLRHRPSGLEVKVQQERSQALNRYLARRLLAAKLEAQLLGRASETQQRIAKIRRQKRRRSRRAKEKMLAAKHQHSRKKQLRAAPHEDD